MSDPPHFLCSRVPVCLDVFGKFLVSEGTYTECERGYQTLVANSDFHSVGPKMVRHSNCLKLHPLAAFFTYVSKSFVHPLGLLEHADGSQRLAAGSFLIECHLFWVTTGWQSALLDILPQPVSSWACLVRHRKVFSSLRKCGETHCPCSRS